MFYNVLASLRWQKQSWRNNSILTNKKNWKFECLLFHCGVHVCLGVGLVMQNKIVCSMWCNSSLCFGCFHCGNGTLGMLHACASVTNYVHAPVCWSIISFALIKNKLRAQTNNFTKYSQMLPCTAGQMQHVVGPIHIPFCATHIHKRKPNRQNMLFANTWPLIWPTMWYQWCW